MPSAATRAEAIRNFLLFMAALEASTQCRNGETTSTSCFRARLPAAMTRLLTPNGRRAGHGEGRCRAAAGFTPLIAWLLPR